MWIYVRTEGPGDVLESSSALALRAGQDVRTVTIRRLLVVERPAERRRFDPERGRIVVKASERTSVVRIR